MNASDRQRWLRAVLLFGVAYFVICMAFGALAGGAATNAIRVNWNRLAFLACGIAFAIHIGYEHFRLRNSARLTALHSSIGVAIGAFGLALMANIHDLGSALGYRPRMLVALVAWPLLTALPAFIVALIVATGLTLTQRSG